MDTATELCIPGRRRGRAARRIGASSSDRSSNRPVCRWCPAADDPRDTYGSEERVPKECLAPLTGTTEKPLTGVSAGQGPCFAPPIGLEPITLRFDLGA